MGNEKWCRDGIELNDGESILVEFFCLFAPVSLVFWLFLVLLLVEIELYAYEPLLEYESGSDELGEENHVRNTEWCQFNHSRDESTGGYLLPWMNEYFIYTR